MKHGSWLLLATLLIACGGCINQNDGSRTDRSPKFVAHRGESVIAPENTVEAYELAWRNGAVWGVETDVHLTRDGVLVCIHDETTDRTAGVSGKISEMTVAELKQLDVGHWKSPEYTNTRIPTLREVLTTLPPNGHIFVEIKKVGPEFAEAFQSAFDGSGVRLDQISFISFDAEELQRVRELLPDNRTLLLLELEAINGQPSISADEVIAQLQDGDFTGIDIGADADVSKEFFSTEYIQKIKKAGYEIHFWTVDDIADARHLIASGADSLTSNCGTQLFREW